VASLVLTASGGPFHGRTRADLADVTVAQALDHPTWAMGGKITIDSATLMNKGLELIEAQVLFDVPESAVETVVHRHSIVHALVRHRDGSLLAHLGWPDMRVPIAWALHWPVRPAVAQARRLDLTDMPALEFLEPDLDTFRCLALAREAARAGGGATCVLNAANEVAVHAFLAGELGFLDIADVVERTLDGLGSVAAPSTLAEAADLDGRARDVARRALTPA
jgi:1-deoxy-D-xylulose-5-phosphate reductoisomerase